LDESASNVERRAMLTIVIIHPRYIYWNSETGQQLSRGSKLACGRYLPKTEVLIATTMADGAKVKARPKISNADWKGESSLHAWKYTGR
jgi:hypothetical protein